jgi:hypothetical protein
VRRALAGLVVAVAAFAPAASSEPQATSCCFVLTISAHGHYQIDYGHDLEVQKTGAYEVTWSWSTKSIAAYEGGRFAFRGPGLLWVDYTEVDDVNDVLSKKTPPYKHYEVPESCRGRDFATRRDGVRAYERASPESLDRFAELDKTLRVAPGTGYEVLKPECPQVDGQDSHGLHGDLRQSPPLKLRKLKKALATGRDFTAGCWQTVVKDDPNPTPHVFEGDVATRVTVDYFSFAELDQREQALQDLVGAKNKVPYISDLVEDARKAAEAGDTDHDCVYK